MKKNLLFVVYQSTGDYNTTILSKKERFDYEKANRLRKYIGKQRIFNISK